MTTLYGKNAISVKTTSAMPLRIKSVQIRGACKELVSSFTGFSAQKDAYYYGVELLNSKTDVNGIGPHDHLSTIPMLLTKSINRTLQIVYTLPYTISGVEFTLVDCKGRGIINHRIEKNDLHSIGTFVWPLTFSSGFYILEMKASIEGSATPYIIRKIVPYLR